MSRQVSMETKMKQHRCEKTGKDYIPYIRVSEFYSDGTRSGVIDQVSERTIHCLSQGEKYLFLSLRWNDNNVEIYEQMKLDLDDTNRIARKLGYKKVNQGKDCMTTDFLVVQKDGKKIALSFKYDKQFLTSEKKADKALVKRLLIEKEYWNEKGVDWFLITMDDINLIRAKNVSMVMRYYDKNEVHDYISLVKHLIATKKICVDMDDEILEFDNGSSPDKAAKAYLKSHKEEDDDDE